MPFNLAYYYAESMVHLSPNYISCHRITLNLLNDAVCVLKICAIVECCIIPLMYIIIKINATQL